MGARAQEAVSFRSQLKDVDLLRLLGVLAAGADDDTGLIDPAPGRDTLAGIFSCTERTITNRMNKLLESGELEVVRVGSGPGRPSAYRLILPIPDVTCFNEERVKKGEKSSTLEARVMALEVGMVELKGEIDAKFFTLLQAIEELKDEISELKGEKGGNEEAERVKRVKGKGESLPEKESIRSYTILTSSNEDVDPHTDRARAGDDDAITQDFWDKALRLIAEWQTTRSDYRILDVQREDDKSAFYAPALRIITEFGGDYAAAWQAVKSEYERMVGDGFNPLKLSAIAPGVVTQLTRSRLPRSDPPVSPVRGGGQGAAVDSFEAYLQQRFGEGVT